MKKTLALIFTALIAVIFFTGVWFRQSVPFSLHEVTDLSLISSPSIYDRNGTLFHARLSPESEWSIPIPLEQMGGWLPKIAVAVEDKRFYSHFGLDALSVGRAMFQNLRARKVVSGASTITSQVIRLSITNRRTRNRNINTKLTEFIQAIKLDSQLPKEKILEIYLNRAPFGGNIRGVEAASRIYFGKSAAMTSPGEAALLIGMLIAPSRYRPDIRPENALRRRNAVITRLKESGVFTEEQARLAFAERIPTARRPLPFRAYHYSQRLFKETNLAQNFSGTHLGASPTIYGRIDSGLDLNIQTALENTLRNTLITLPKSITAAAGIIDNRTKQIVGWVGNARFDKDKTWRRQGGAETVVPAAWVDCGMALRSPGSAIKPFAWIAAFDAGKITPGTLLSDTPIAFSGRAPRNFDLTYRGAVSARVALADSLNAPSVRVLRLANQERVLELMRRSGLVSLTRSSSHYGDSLILGGCDIRLADMLEAYSVIADGGEKFYGSRFIPSLNHGNNSISGRIFSEESAWLISDILSDTRRLSFLARESLQLEGRRVAFKTGTSYGLRDAWTAAWTQQFTIVVWFGDPSGKGWDGLIGLNIATPPAFQALRLASLLTSPATGNNSAWFNEIPAMLEQRRLCSLSGRPPVNACPNTRSEWIIRGVTNMLPCDLHSIKDGRSITTLPPELGFMTSERDGKRIRRSGLEIVSPIRGGRYIVSSVARERQKIPFRAEGGYERLYWFVNGMFVGESSPVLPLFYAPPPGQHNVSVMDALGRTASTEVDVATVEFQREEILEFQR